MKKLRFVLFTLLLLTAFSFSATADEPDWSAIRQNEAWYYAADGSVVTGKLTTIVNAWLKGEGKKDPTVRLTVYICQNKTLKIKKIKRADLSRFKFKVDKKALPKAKKKIVQVSEQKPGAGEPGILAGNENKKITAYLWLEDPDTDEALDNDGGTVDTLDAAGTENENDAIPLTTETPSPDPSSPGGGMGGGGFGGSAAPHAKEKHQSEIGYDQVGIQTLAKGEVSPMSTLVLSGEEQELSLTQDERPSDFIPTLIEWQNMSAGLSENADAENTLLLRAQTEEEGVPRHWVFSGSLLRKLLRSGISYLALEAENQVVFLPTEGFLGGTLYDELKMCGTAGSSFCFDICMDGGDTIQISVTVGENSTLLTGDQQADMYWTDIRFLSGSELDLPEPTAQEEG